MILVDPRSGPESQQYRTTVDSLVSHIRRIGVSCEKGSLEYADLAFEGNGPNGRVMIGIERKTLHDMLHCIDDSRYSAYQKIGMGQMYQVSILMIEGVWKPYDPDGWLMEGFKGGASWGLCRYRSSSTPYTKLFNYLLSIQLSNIIVCQSRDLWGTAFNATSIYAYFQKPWESHTSMLETQKLQIPDMRIKPSLVRRWAAEIDDIGVKHSLQAEDLFKTPIRLANSDESDWIKLSRLGVKTARKIVSQIRGW
jgi:ERCC4-type nuclease